MQIDEAWRRLDEAADLAARRGSLIFHLDLATAAASAAFAAADIAIGDVATLVDDKGYHVIAFDAAPLTRPVADARFDAAGGVTLDLAPQGTPPRAETLARARRTVAAAHTDGRARSIVVVPASDAQASLEAYAISVGDSAAAMIVSDHWHFTLTPDGRIVTARRPLDAAVGHGIDREAGSEANLHSAGDVPSEIHAYLSLKHGVRVNVQTAGSGVRWHVDGERTTVAGR